MFTKLVTALALCAATSGCIVVDDTNPPSSTSYGVLTALWTLDNANDVDVCSYYGVDRVDVVIFDDDGYDVGGAQPFCEDFGVSFDVSAGWYSTEVTLLDVNGNIVSDTVGVVDLLVERDNEVIVDIDFPDSSIY
jgi:hypothetical protein